MSILIVDDNEIFLILLDKMLQPLGFPVIWANSGAKALESMQGNPDVRIVIADIDMPEMSGLEMLARMKKSSLLKDIPVILCSVLSDVESIRQGAMLGCNSYLLKPVQREHLLQKVKQTLASRKAVVSPLRSVQTKTGMESKSCLSLIQAFEKLLKNQIQALEAYRQNPAIGLPPLLLLQLAEGAEIIGAEPLVRRIGEVSKAFQTQVDLDKHLLLFMRDMRDLVAELEAQMDLSFKPTSQTSPFGRTR